MKSIFIVICLWFAVLCAAQTAPPNPAPSVEARPPAPTQDTARNGQRPPGVAGIITAMDGNAFTIKTREGQTVQVTVSEKTEYRKGRQPAKVSDFKVGDMIFVRGEKNGDNAWTAEIVGARSGGPGQGNFREGLGKEFIAGEVKSINRTQLTIQRPDGVAQTISVDENTSFRKDGESVTLADLKVGDHVFGRGQLKNDVFVPAVLNVGQPNFRMQHGTAAPEQH